MATDKPIVLPNRRGRIKNRRKFGRKVYVTNQKRSAWKSIPFPIRWMLYGMSVVFLGSAVILITLFAIGLAQAT